jgi:hypothetical protein
MMVPRTTRVAIEIAQAELRYGHDEQFFRIAQDLTLMRKRCICPNTGIQSADCQVGSLDVFHFVSVLRKGARQRFTGSTVGLAPTNALVSGGGSLFTDWPETGS